MTHALSALLLAFALPQSSEPPRIVVVPGGKPVIPDPIPPSPAPIPTSAAVSGERFELLTLVGYTGAVTWDVTSPTAVMPPVVIFEKKAGAVSTGWRMGATGPAEYPIGETPTVEVYAIGDGAATVAAWGVNDSRPVKLATFQVIANKGPRPPPEPDPTKPDGVLGLIKASRDGMAKVNSPTKAADAAKLAKAQRGIASAIAAGGVSQPAAILAAWRDSNKATVDGATWKPWGEVVSPALSKLYADGKLTDKAAWVAAFGEIADGLEGK